MCRSRFPSFEYFAFQLNLAKRGRYATGQFSARPNKPFSRYLRSKRRARKTSTWPCKCRVRPILRALRSPTPARYQTARWDDDARCCRQSSFARSRFESLPKTRSSAIRSSVQNEHSGEASRRQWALCDSVPMRQVVVEFVDPHGRATQSVSSYV